jgi:hypothetical protein
MGNVEEGCGRRGGGLRRGLAWWGGGYKCNAGYNRVGIEGGESGRVGWARGKCQRVGGGEGDIFVARQERREGFKRSVGIARVSLTMINGGEWHCRIQ